MAAKYVCDVPKCGNEISELCGSHGGPKICKRCYSALAYARKQGDEWIPERKERLQFLTERIEHFEPLVTKILKRAAQRVAEARARARAH